MKDLIKIEDYEKGVLIYERENSVVVEMAYPRQNKTKHIEVGISDVRASDGIRITYDFDRDGYIIEQPTQLSWNVDDKICDPKWKEVAFIQSWALSEEQDANEPN